MTTSARKETGFDNMLPVPVSKARSRDSLAFLPAAMELLETPPNPAGRTLALMLALLFSLAGLWAYHGRMDITATAQGRLITSDRTKVIQPLETGTIKAIHVQEGQRVERGQILLELNPTEVTADLTRLQRDLSLARLEAARLDAELAGRDRLELDDLTSSIPGSMPGSIPGSMPGSIADSMPGLVSLQQSLLTSRLDEKSATLKALQSETAQLRAQQGAIDADIAGLQATLPIIRERAESSKTLMAKGHAAKLQTMELEQVRIEAEHKLKAAHKRRAEIEAGLAAITDRKAEIEARFKSEALDRLQQAQTQIGTLEQEAVKLQDRAQRRILKAPVSGTIQELQIHTVDGVVTPAQPLMNIVPQDQTLLLEARIENKDIGFIKEGQQVEVKVDSFPFTKYGLIQGTIQKISDDAIAEDTPNGPQYGFVAQVALDRQTLLVENQTVALQPGMTAQADIKTGTRRLIEFVLAPLLKAGAESMRER